MCEDTCVHMRVQGSEEDRGDTDLSLETLSLIEPGAGLVTSKPHDSPLCMNIFLPEPALQHAWIFMWDLGI